MKQPHLIGTLFAVMLSFTTLSANAAFHGRLETFPGSGIYRAYYDDLLEITWAANANILGFGTWDNRVSAVASLTIGGVGGWRLPNMDVNGDGIIVHGLFGTELTSLDNEYTHLYFFGASLFFGLGVTPLDPHRFTNIQPSQYWSSAEWAPFPPDLTGARAFHFGIGENINDDKSRNGFAWPVQSGDIGVVPLPAAAWLFGSDLMGLLGLARQKR